MSNLGKLAFYAVLGITGFGGLAVVGNVVGSLTSVVTAPGRVLQETLRTDNIISSYEWFHDSHGQLKARVSQINGHRALLSDTTDPKETSRLRIELAGIQQSCRDLANRYNANATKTNKSIFMGREAPASIDTNICE